MSDDLVKMLRGRCNCNMLSSPCGSEDECRFDFQAADRIEELEAKVWDNFQLYVDANEARIEAEAKLAKAVEALDDFIRLDDDYSPFGGELLQDRVERTWRNARATLAELNYDERSEKKGEDRG